MAIVKQVEKINNKWVMPVVALVASVGIGGLFIGGTFLKAPILSIVPPLGHVIVGWALIVSSILAVGLKLAK